jgi:hypothetical protein
VLTPEDPALTKYESVRDVDGSWSARLLLISGWCFIGRPRRQAALKPDFSTTDWAADGAEYPEHDADHHKDSADRVKNREACKVSNQEKDDAKHNHGQSDPLRRKLELAYG